MASVGSLTVEIAANIASLRTGIEEANSRVSSMEKQMARSSAKMQSSFETSVAGIKTAWIQGTAAIYASIATLSKAWELANIAASYDEQKGYLDNLSSQYKTSADEIVTSMQTASEGLISKTALMEVALGGLSKSLKPDQLIALSSAANTIGDAAGVNATEALKDLSYALETGKTKSLMPYVGTALDLKTTFGDLAEKMTAAEKAQAMYSVTMLYANKIQSQQSKEISNSADKFEQMTAKYENLKLQAGFFSKTILVAAADNLTFSNSLDISGEKLANYTMEFIKSAAPVIRLIQLYKMLKQAKDEAETSTYGKSNIATIQIPDNAKPGANTAETEYQNQLASLKKILQARSDAEKAAKNMAKDAEKAAMDAQREAEKSYQDDLRIFEIAENGKVKAAQDTAQARIKELEFVYDHSFKAYDDELNLITDRGKLISSTYELERDSIQAQIENIGRSKEKKAEIADLTIKWETANQEAIQATADMEMQIFDMQHNRAMSLYDEISQLNQTINDTQKSISRNAIGEIQGASDIVNPLGNLMDVGSENDPYQQQIDKTQEMYDKLVAMEGTFEADMLSRQIGFQNSQAMLQYAQGAKEVQLEKLKNMQKVSSAQYTFGTLAALANAFYQASERQNEAAFVAFKALAVAETAIATYKAVMLTWADSSLGPWYVKAAAAAVVAATGAMNIANILSTQPGTASSVQTSTGSAPVVATTGSADTSSATPSINNSKEVTVTINIMGNVLDKDAFAREIVPSIRKAISDNV
jgi:hypothetical protein